MSTEGYYRYKVSDLTKGTRLFSFFVNGALTSTKTVIAKSWCTNQKLLKYLDSKGQYRFYPFNNRWEQKDKPKLLGTTNQFITNILDAQSNFKNVGYKNERMLSLIAEDVTADELTVLSDIYTSPDVYLYIGTTTDEAKDWLRVTLSSGDNLSRRRKAIAGTLSVDIILPEWFTIKLI